MHIVNKHWIKTFIFKKIIGMTYFRLFFLMINLMEKKSQHINLLSVFLEFIIALKGEILLLFHLPKQCYFLTF